MKTKKRIYNKDRRKDDLLLKTNVLPQFSQSWRDFSFHSIKVN